MTYQLKQCRDAPQVLLMPAQQWYAHESERKARAGADMQLKEGGRSHSQYDQLLCCQRSDTSDPHVVPLARVRDSVDAETAADAFT